MKPALIKAAGPSLLVIAVGALSYCLGQYTSSAVRAHPFRAGELIASTPHLPAGPISDPRADAYARVGSALLVHGDLHELARLPTLLDALDNEQLRQLLDSVDRQLPDERLRLMPRLLAYWTRRDPQAATEWLKPKLHRFAHSPSFAAGFADLNTEIVRAWAENAPELALEFARRSPATKFAEIAIHCAIYSPGAPDNSRILSLIQTFPQGPTRESVMSSLFFNWAQMDAPGALASASSLSPGIDRDRALAQTLSRLGGSRPAEVFAKADSLGIDDPGVLATTVLHAARSNPHLAADWLERHQARLPLLGSVVVRAWAERDPAEAFAWAQTHNISILDTASALIEKMPIGMPVDKAEIRGYAPLYAALNSKPSETLAWINALPPGPDRDRFLELALANQAHTAKVKPQPRK